MLAAGVSNDPVVDELSLCIADFQNNEKSPWKRKKTKNAAQIPKNA